MTMVAKTSSVPLGFWAVLREAIKIPLRNGMLMLSIAIALFISSSLLCLANHYALVPVSKDLVLKYSLWKTKEPASSEYIKLLAGVQEDIQILVGEGTIFILATYVSTILLTLAMIYASAVSYSGKHLNHKELISVIGRTWKRLVITWLYVNLIEIGFVILLISLIVVLVATAHMLFLAFAVLAGLFLILLLVYLGVIWKLGLVVSVVEEGYSGLRALGRADELIQGRKLQGFFLSFLITLVYFGITVIFYVKMMDIKLAKVTRLGLGVASMSITFVEQLFIFVVFTVFYFECKKSHGEEVVIQGEYGYGYGPVSTTPNVDASLP